MAVDFKNLGNPIENRRIREVIVAQGQTITIFEPSVKDFEDMVEFQEQKLDEAGSVDSIDISGVEMTKFFFPRLTDIVGLEDLSDEEIEAIAEEPSIALLQVEEVISQIIAESFKTIILSAQTKIVEADFAAESASVNEKMFDIAFTKAAQKMGAGDVLDRVKLSDEEYQKALDTQNEIHHAVRNEFNGTLDKTPILSGEKSEEDVLKELEETNPHLKARNLHDQYMKDFN